MVFEAKGMVFLYQYCLGAFGFPRDIYRLIFLPVLLSGSVVLVCFFVGGIRVYAFHWNKRDHCLSYSHYSFGSVPARRTLDVSSYQDQMA